MFLCRCVFRRSSGSFAVSGRKSVRVGRRITTTAPIRAPTPPPSWTAASRRCPPSAPARDVLPPDSTLHHGPPPRTKSSSQGHWEKDSQARCPRSLRTLGRCWTGGALMRRSSMEPQRERYGGKWSTNWHTAASSGHAPTPPLTGSDFKNTRRSHCWRHKTLCSLTEVLFRCDDSTCQVVVTIPASSSALITHL